MTELPRRSYNLARNWTEYRLSANVERPGVIAPRIVIDLTFDGDCGVDEDGQWASVDAARRFLEESYPAHTTRLLRIVHDYERRPDA